jgi:hypothetical protein
MFISPVGEVGVVGRKDVAAEWLRPFQPMRGQRCPPSAGVETGRSGADMTALDLQILGGLRIGVFVGLERNVGVHRSCSPAAFEFLSVC